MGRAMAEQGLPGGRVKRELGAAWRCDRGGSGPCRTRCHGEVVQAQVWWSGDKLRRRRQRTPAASSSPPSSSSPPLLGSLSFGVEAMV